MVTFILFVLIFSIGVYAYNTRQRLINIANFLDRKHIEIDEALRGNVIEINDLKAKAHRHIKR